MPLMRSNYGVIFHGIVVFVCSEYTAERRKLLMPEEYKDETTDAGPTSNILERNDNGARQHALALARQKSAIERAIADQSAVLEAQGVDLHAPLVDEDGYPRADIDVYAVRHARATIRRLQTDHTSIMRAIEAALCDVHKTSADATISASHNCQTTSAERDARETAFLSVADVLPDSPAELATLCVGDRVCRIGSLTAVNFGGNLGQLAELLRYSGGQCLPVHVRRGGLIVRLTLCPQVWAGRGLTGCKFVPISGQHCSPER